MNNRIIDDILSTLSRKKKIDPDLLFDKDLEYIKKKIMLCINPVGDEIDARKNTVELGNIYYELSNGGKIQFLKILNNDFDVDEEEITQAIKDRNNYRKLYKVLEPKRNKVLRQFSALDNGIKFLVKMRSDILKTKNVNLSKLDNSLFDLLSIWFDVGLLSIEKITWQASAELLEKLIQYEAVHKIKSWEDLKNRLESDRCCFAFFHPNMSGEPLIFVEVAFTVGISTNIQELLEEDRSKLTQDPDTAIFYSISNTQRGLKNISLGNFLIKQVVEKIQSEHQSIKVFSTLSPIPGFLAWIETASQEELNIIIGDCDELLELTGEIYLKNALLSSLKEEWINDEEIKRYLKAPLLQLCSYYLIRCKNQRGGALDPVANFHLSNGATLRNINWLANNSKKALKESAGIMVNYQYDLNKIKENHIKYIKNQEVIFTKNIKAPLNTLKIKNSS